MTKKDAFGLAVYYKQTTGDKQLIYREIDGNYRVGWTSSAVKLVKII